MVTSAMVLLNGWQITAEIIEMEKNNVTIVRRVEKLMTLELERADINISLEVR
jgi:hypothetical protein